MKYPNYSQKYFKKFIKKLRRLYFAHKYPTLNADALWHTISNAGGSLNVAEIGILGLVYTN